MASLDEGVAFTVIVSALFSFLPKDGVRRIENELIFMVGVNGRRLETTGASGKREEGRPQGAVGTEPPPEALCESCVAHT